MRAAMACQLPPALGRTGRRTTAHSICSPGSPLVALCRALAARGLPARPCRHTCRPAAHRRLMRRPSLLRAAFDPRGTRCRPRQSRSRLLPRPATSAQTRLVGTSGGPALPPARRAARAGAQARHSSLARRGGRRTLSRIAPLKTRSSSAAPTAGSTANGSRSCSTASATCRRGAAVDAARITGCGHASAAHSRAFSPRARGVRARADTARACPCSCAHRSVGEELRRARAAVGARKPHGALDEARHDAGAPRGVM